MILHLCQTFGRKHDAKIAACITVFGGFASVGGDASIRLTAWLVEGKGIPQPWHAFFLDPVMMTVVFLSGCISVGVLVVPFIKRIRASIAPQVLYTGYGALFGASAGIINVVVLTSLYLCSAVVSGIMAKAITTTQVFSFFGNYLPLVLITMGPPAAIIGGLVGLLAEIILRKWVFRRGDLN